MVGKAREGTRAIAGPPSLSADQSVRQQWIELCNETTVGVSNSADEFGSMTMNGGVHLESAAGLSNDWGRRPSNDS